MGMPRENRAMLAKLGVVALGMFAFGYGLVPLYQRICEATGINILALSERQVPGNAAAQPANTQVDTSRTITVEFDANAHGPWAFKPAQRAVQVHPGELATVVYEFQHDVQRVQLLDVLLVGAVLAQSDERPRDRLHRAQERALAWRRRIHDPASVPRRDTAACGADNARPPTSKKV